MSELEPRENASIETEMRVIHAEDDPEFVEVTSEVLESQNPDMEVMTATTAEEALQKIKEEEVECVVSDHEMPEMTGLELLEEVRNIKPDLPFILFTGKGSEDIASEAISEGVTDYLQKKPGTDQYRVLANRIRNAVQRYRAEEALRESEEKYRTLVEQSHDAIYIYSGRDFLFVNEGVTEITGYTEEELYELDVFELIHPDDREKVKNLAIKRAKGENPKNTYEARVVTKEGDVRHCEFSVESITYDGEYAALGSVRDITERKKREVKLREERDRVSALFENTSDCIVETEFVDGEPIVRDVNRAFEEIFGYSKDEILGESIDDFVVPPEKEGEAEEINEFVVGGGEVNREVQRMTAEGERDFLLRGVKYKSEGENLRSFAVYTDITERKEMEAELREAKEKYRNLVEQDLVGIYIIQENSFVYVNSKMADMFGYDEDKLIEEMKPLDLVSEEDHDKVLKRLQQRQEGEKETVNYTFTGKTKQGDEIDVEVYGSDTQIDGEDAVIGIIMDVTERMEREREIKESRQKYRTLIEAAPDPIFIADPETGKIVETNQKASDLLNKPEEDIIGMHQSELHPSEDIDKYRKLFKKHVENDGGMADKFEDESNLYVVDSDGEKIPVEISARTLEVGDQYLLQGVFRDISERQEREEKLRRQNERLEEFASVVSHDLRNPLSVAQGNLEMAMQTGEDRFLEEIYEAHQRMENLIEDLLTLAREGEKVGETTKINIESAAKEAWENVDTAEATLDIDEELSLINADYERICQMFENLIRNAVEHGGENVTVRFGEFEKGFYIEDDGPGIPQEKRDKVFDHGYSTEEKGTGFGLPIVKTICEAHGWNITATEGEEGGARFEISV